MAVKSKEEKAHQVSLALLKILNTIHDKFGNITLQEILLFLSVHREPDQSQQFHANALHFPKSNVQRIMELLTDKGFRAREGMGIVEARRSPVHWREKNYSLTPKGKALIRSIQNHLDDYAIAIEKLER